MLRIIWLTFVIVSILYSQAILFDDVNNCHPVSAYSGIISILEFSGFRVYNVSNSGWYMLDSVCALWIAGPVTNYPDSIKHKLLNFVRNGGKIYITAQEMSVRGYINDLLTYGEWNTGLMLRCWNTTIGCDGPGFMQELSPVTDGIYSIYYPWTSSYVSITDTAKAFPIIYCASDEEHWRPLLAISYPFIDNDESGYIILHCEGDMNEGDSIDIPPAHRRLNRNIFYAMCDINGHIPVGTRPGDLKECKVCYSFPDPFTPNGDGINDFCQFWFLKMGISPASIYIYDSHSILVREIDVSGRGGGVSVNVLSRWDGRDFSGKPVPQGVYLYVIEQEGKIICTGTVTVAR